jgi:hypothetical protein
MERRPPKPVCKCFTLCKQLFIDPDKNDFTLVTPVYQVFPTQYPAVEDLSVFARWTNAHGTYTIEVQLRDLEGEVLWRAQMNRPFEMPDPLLVVQVPLRHLKIRFPRDGKYEVALLANGEQVAEDIIQAHPVPRSGAG